MFQASPSREQVEGDVENVICFAVGSFDFKDRSVLVDYLAEIKLFNDLHDRPESTAGDRLRLFSQFVLHTGTLNPDAIEGRIVEAFGQLTLAFGQLFS